MDTQTIHALESAIEQDRRLVQAEKAALAAAMEEKQDRFQLDSYTLQKLLALGLVITVLASAVTA